MRYGLTDHEWATIRPVLPNKPRGILPVNDRRVLNGIFWVLRSGAPVARSAGKLWAVHDLLQPLHSLASGWRVQSDHGRAGGGS